MARCSALIEQGIIHTCQTYTKVMKITFAKDTASRTSRACSYQASEATCGR